jgi:hypothetical protein
MTTTPDDEAPPFNLDHFEDWSESNLSLGPESQKIAGAAATEIRRLRKLLVSDAREKKSRLAIAITIVVGVISAGAMASSCAGQAINYRQMKAIETIAADCAAVRR